VDKTILATAGYLFALPLSVPSKRARRIARLCDDNHGRLVVVEWLQRTSRTMRVMSCSWTIAEILASASSALSIECNGRKGGGRSLVDAENSVTTHCGSFIRYYVFTPVTNRSNIRENMTTRLQQAATSSRCYTVSRAFVPPPLTRICATAGIATAEVHPRISVNRVYVSIGRGHCPSPKSVRSTGRTISTNVQFIILYGDSEDKNVLRIWWTINNTDM